MVNDSPLQMVADWFGTIGLGLTVSVILNAVPVQAELVSGTSIKTINSTSLLGSGNIVIAAQGIQGTTGNTGSQGTTGTSGSQGTTGTTGSNGAQGAQGITGSQGFTGIQGLTGLQGFTGTGSQGITGIQGLTGVQGIQGLNGLFAAQGVQGVQGITGPGVSSIYRLTAQTLTAASWVLVSGYYTYTFSNVNITTNTRVDFTPDNASINEVSTCRMLPKVDVTTGSCTFYSLFPPQTNVTGEITIFSTV
jgi:hypothetical protein